VQLAIVHKNSKPIEIRDLYDSLTSVIPRDGDEQLKLVEILKMKGFIVTDWGRGNFSFGPRSVVVTLKKGQCNCTVTKFYYTVMNDSAFIRTESISCR
jgi:hypothetical protein